MKYRANRILSGICFVCVFFVVTTASINVYQSRISNKKEMEIYNEYIQWESKMLKKNPDYENVKILVDISVKKLYLLSNNELIKTYTIASGKEGSPSPIGSWKVIDKGRWGGGFGTRWMGINVPWGKYGIHGTNKPNSIGHDSSAGCIRMRNEDVEDLYPYVKNGTPVVIINGMFGPFGYGFNPIKPGDFGSDVMEVQVRLRALGYYNAEYLDGKYGPSMEHAVYQFQKDHNLPKNPIINEKMFESLGIIKID